MKFGTKTLFISMCLLISLILTKAKDEIKKTKPSDEGAKMPMVEPIPSEKPNKFQQAQIARKYGMFIHFGINTFHDEEWTDGSKPASSYNPKTIDAKNWVTTAREAGMKYVILVTKHHDGFCLWDSPHTEYDVGSSPNKTNVVEAMAIECKKQGIGLGLYYSLWDRKQNANTKDPSLDAAYNQYMLKQLEELFIMAGKHGPVVELWLDGSWEKGHTRWALPEIYALVKKHQPACQMGVNWTIGHPDAVDTMCHANQQKEGFPIRYFPSDFRLGDPELPINPDPKIFAHNGKRYYMPWETTVCLTEKWFYNSKDKTYKTPDALKALYQQATAQDNILIINCPPTTEGRMREDDAKVLNHLGEILGLVHKK